MWSPMIELQPTPFPHVQDVDVSGQMSVNRNVETGLSQIWWTVLRNGGCLRPDDSRGLVLDVGANFGYYALYAASLGCRCCLCVLLCELAVLGWVTVKCGEHLCRMVGHAGAWLMRPHPGLGGGYPKCSRPMLRTTPAAAALHSFC